MKVSIVMPVYQVEDYVESSLLSVLGQDYPELEVVIVDDASRDNSMRIVAELLTRINPRCEVKLVRHESNQGLSAARNTGVRESTGDYLFFCDSDDELFPDSVTSLMAATRNGKAEMVVGDYELRGSTLPFPLLDLDSSFLVGRKKIARAFLGDKVYPMAWNKLVRRDFILRHGLFFKEGLVHEDRLWSFACALHLSKAAVVKKKTYIYNVRANSIMTSARIEDDFKAYLEVVAGMVKDAVRLRMMGNRWVFSFIEEEKFFLNYMFLEKGVLSRDSVLKYKETIYNQPYGLFRIFWWGLLHKSYRIRDAHYFLPDGLKFAYYEKLPVYKWRTSERFLMKAFNQWYAKVLFCRLVPLCECPGLFNA